MGLQVYFLYTVIGNRCAGGQFVNKAVVSFPDCDVHLVNYIVARPEQTSFPSLHAEKVLLNRFNVLKDRYPKSLPVSTVLFYSWLMPCSGCTKTLIQKFSKSGYNVVVVYNSDWKAVEEDSNEENRNSLRRVGIEVYQIRYNRMLPLV